MSAAATAAGYLYASGRLRGKSAREQADGEDKQRPEKRDKPAHRADRVKVGAVKEVQDTRVGAAPAPDRPRRAPRVEYRVRRWSPEKNGSPEHE